MTPSPFDPTRALAGLKDFQRRTVNHVFRRMWLENPPATRFLVADEVGLGKTLVARGVIAKTLDHLRETVPRIDVVYICSNAAIAQQNVNRLNVVGKDHVAMATRLTLLPLVLHQLENKRVNFVSFTPGTTFDLKSSGGIWRERVLLHRLLSPELPHLTKSLVSVLRCTVGLKQFEDRIANHTTPVNESLGRTFVEDVSRDRTLLDKVHDVCDRFLRPDHEITTKDRVRQYGLIGELRLRLARVCINALEPDLVILDEFQRFRDLLDGDNEAARLARLLMNYVTPEGNDVRILMLSATPYKPLTLSTDEEDHYRDFLRTLGFLFDDPARVAHLEENLRAYRRGLYRTDDPDLPVARQAVEGALRAVMVRTERVGRTVELDAMLRSHIGEASITTGDLDYARFTDTVACELNAQDTIEYWKSAPHVLHFMRDYQIRKKLEATASDPPAGLLEAVKRHQGRLLSRGSVSRYQDIGYANGRLRLLMEDMVEPGQWQLLWAHPSLPYMRPGGAYARVPPFTKALIFSSWTVVPDVIAATCSYEVERRMLQGSGDLPRYTELHEARRPLLRFTETRGRLTGMPALALMYPSVALARAIDPLRLAIEVGGGAPADVDELKRRAAGRIEVLLSSIGLERRGGDGPVDQRWYWAALAVLDRPYIDSVRWWVAALRGQKAELADGEDESGLKKHAAWFLEVAGGALDDELGRPPDDLADVLVDMALASPTVAAVRALARVTPGLEPGSRSLCQAAAHVAGGFRTLFNLPETTALLRGDDEEAYWRLILQHSLDGNLQAVLDEYAHFLRDSLGLADHPSGEIAHGVGRAMAEALSLRTAPVSADEIAATVDGRIELKRMRFRTRFALRFGDLRDDRDQTLNRAGTVRAAFNSPFRPFILASTSVGQEGLDFHPYCHAVYHWNLPANAVDLEQREGRVHRYKGHAVRRNVAQRWGLSTLAARLDGHRDPWQVLFDAAAEDREPGMNELVPYWIYEEGDARVERRVLTFPFSREVGRLERLQRALAVYRLAFGQPRQEDLLAYLADHTGGLADIASSQRIVLEPPEAPEPLLVANGAGRDHDHNQASPEVDVGNEKGDFVEVLVPRELLLDVYRLIADRTRSGPPVEGPTPVPEEALDATDWPEPLLQRLYTEAPRHARAILDELARRPGEVVPATDLIHALARARKRPADSRTLAGTMGALTRRVRKRYKRRDAPFSSRWDTDTAQVQYSMSAEVAEVIRGLG
jgi:hypothetical protein